MIYDRLDRAGSYHAVHPLLGMAVTFLSRSDLPDLQDGRHELSGGAFASVQTYETKKLEVGEYETHQSYADVQCVLAGEEWIYVSHPGLLTETQPYRAEDDCALYHGEPASRLLMQPGSFLLLFPQDAHMPSIEVDAPGRVKKVVVKLPLEERDS